MNNARFIDPNRLPRKTFFAPALTARLRLQIPHQPLESLPVRVMILLIPMERVFAGASGDLLYLAHFSEAGEMSVGVISGSRFL